jgi:hypothetical protein
LQRKSRQTPPRDPKPFPKPLSLLCVRFANFWQWREGDFDHTGRGEENAF